MTLFNRRESHGYWSAWVAQQQECEAEVQKFIDKVVDEFVKQEKEIHDLRQTVLEELR